VIHKAVKFLVATNPLFANIVINNNWEDECLITDPLTWKSLSNQTVSKPLNSIDADFEPDSDVELNKEECTHNSVEPKTCMDNDDDDTEIEDETLETKLSCLKTATFLQPLS